MNNGFEASKRNGSGSIEHWRSNSIPAVVVINEFENDLHPHMLKPIIDLFDNDKSNPHQAYMGLFDNYEKTGLQITGRHAKRAIFIIGEELP